MKLLLGAKSDVAKALAVLYAKEGHNLILAAKQVHDLIPFQKKIQDQYPIQIQLKEFDITQTQSHHLFYQNLHPKPLSVILAIGYLGNQKTSEENWDETLHILSVNLIGAISILNIIALDFEEKKTGTIIGISSVAGDRGRKKNYTYGSAKAGLTTYLSGLRNRLYPHTHVITIKPGFIYSKMTQHLKLPKLLTSTPLDVAKDILNAEKYKKNVVYSKWFWKFIMIIITHLPESLFKQKNI